MDRTKGQSDAASSTRRLEDDIKEKKENLEKLQETLRQTNETVAQLMTQLAEQKSAEEREQGSQQKAFAEQAQLLTTAQETTKAYEQQLSDSQKAREQAAEESSKQQQETARQVSELEQKVLSQTTQIQSSQLQLEEKKRIEEESAKKRAEEAHEEERRQREEQLMEQQQAASTSKSATSPARKVDDSSPCQASEMIGRLHTGLFSTATSEQSQEEEESPPAASSGEILLEQKDLEIFQNLLLLADPGYKIMDDKGRPFANPTHDDPRNREIFHTLTANYALFLKDRTPFQYWVTEFTPTTRAAKEKVAKAHRLSSALQKNPSQRNIEKALKSVDFLIRVTSLQKMKQVILSLVAIRDEKEGPAATSRAPIPNLLQVFPSPNNLKRQKVAAIALCEKQLREISVEDAAAMKEHFESLRSHPEQGNEIVDKMKTTKDGLANKKSKLEIEKFLKTFDQLSRKEDLNIALQGLLEETQKELANIHAALKRVKAAPSPLTSSKSLRHSSPTATTPVPAPATNLRRSTPLHRQKK